MDAAEHLFQLVACEPYGLAVNGTLAPDLPQRRVALEELRRLLTHPLMSNATRDLVWRELVTRARVLGAMWVVGAVGVALPGLRAIAGRITSGYVAGDAADIDHEVLSSFIKAVRSIEVDQPSIRPRLYDEARLAGERLRRLAESGTCHRLPINVSVPPAHPSSHPETGGVPDCLSQTITSPCVGDAGAEASARSRDSSDIPSELHQPKGGRGTTPGSARISTATSRATPSRRPQDAPAVEGLTRDAPLPTTPCRMASGVQRQRLLPVLPCRAAVRVSVIVGVAAFVVAVTAAVATGAFGESGAWAAPPTDADQLGKVFDNLRNWLIGLLATLATLMLTIGGVRYLVAGGDPGEVQKAKSALKAAAFGYALAVLAPLFVNVLKRVVGG
ncbi:hypothetical protein [Streptosporangium sp. KLBMP 9127]|nr:hypothetical protein [Streptosporangium sp. KLBMP 9127]